MRTSRQGFRLTILVLLIAAAAPTASAQCTVGVSSVACMNPLRSVIVAKDGTGKYQSIQPALNAALPGDVIYVKNGTYTDPVIMINNGQPNNPIMLMNYPGNTPVIAPPCAAPGYTISMVGNWLVLSGFEITTGWDGVDVYGSNNLITNNYIHDTCGQGIIVASAHDVAITKNRIASNGLKNSKNYLFHGIYFSDYYVKGMYNLSMINNSINNHGGGGVQSWDITQRKKNLLIQNNTFNNNTFDIILTNTDDSTVSGNSFVHSGYPTTTFAQSGILWLELNSNINFTQNLFQYGITQTTTGGTANYLIFADQPSVGMNFSANTWQLPAGYPAITDVMVNYVLAH